MDKGLIFFLVFVVIIVVNIVKNVKKQQQMAANTPGSPGNRPILREEEDDFWEDTTPASRKAPVYQVQQVQSKPKVEPILPKTELKKMQVDSLKETEVNDNAVSVAFNNADDARQAFIYSEIWNRKY